MKHQNTAENLAALVKAIATANTAGDESAAAQLTKTLFPSVARVRNAFVPDLPPGFEESLGAMYERVPPDDDLPSWARLLNIKPGRTNVQVHTATGAEIAAYEKGSTAFNEFPGGAQKVAQGGLCADAVFHEVECTAPGTTSGTRLHMFFWDGTAWVMLGPVWRMRRP